MKRQQQSLYYTNTLHSSLYQRDTGMLREQLIDAYNKSEQQALMEQQQQQNQMVQQAQVNAQAAVMQQQMAPPPPIPQTTVNFDYYTMGLAVNQALQPIVDQIKQHLQSVPQNSDPFENLIGKRRRPSLSAERSEPLQAHPMAFQQPVNQFVNFNESVIDDQPMHRAVATSAIDMIAREKQRLHHHQIPQRGRGESALLQSRVQSSVTSQDSSMAIDIPMADASTDPRARSKKLQTSVYSVESLQARNSVELLAQDREKMFTERQLFRQPTRLQTSSNRLARAIETDENYLNRHRSQPPARVARTPSPLQMDYNRIKSLVDQSITDHLQPLVLRHMHEMEPDVKEDFKNLLTRLSERGESNAALEEKIRQLSTDLASLVSEIREGRQAEQEKAIREAGIKERKGITGDLFKEVPELQPEETKVPREIMQLVESNSALKSQLVTLGNSMDKISQTITDAATKFAQGANASLTIRTNIGDILGQIDELDRTLQDKLTNTIVGSHQNAIKQLTGVVNSELDNAVSISMSKLKDAFKIEVDEELKKVNQLVEHNINESANRVIQGIDRNVKVTAELDYDRGALQKIREQMEKHLMLHGTLNQAHFDEQIKKAVERLEGATDQHLRQWSVKLTNVAHKTDPTEMVNKFVQGINRELEGKATVFANEINEQISTDELIGTTRTLNVTLQQLSTDVKAHSQTIDSSLKKFYSDLKHDSNLYREQLKEKMLSHDTLLEQAKNAFSSDHRHLVSLVNQLQNKISGIDFHKAPKGHIGDSQQISEVTKSLEFISQNLKATQESIESSNTKNDLQLQSFIAKMDKKFEDGKKQNLTQTEILRQLQTAANTTDQERDALQAKIDQLHARQLQLYDEERKYRIDIADSHANKVTEITKAAATALQTISQQAEKIQQDNGKVISDKGVSVLNELKDITQQFSDASLSSLAEHSQKVTDMTSKTLDNLLKASNETKVNFDDLTSKVGTLAAAVDDQSTKQSSLQTKFNEMTAEQKSYLEQFKKSFEKYATDYKSATTETGKQYLEKFEQAKKTLLDDFQTKYDQIKPSFDDKSMEEISAIMARKLDSKLLHLSTDIQTQMRQELIDMNTKSLGDQKIKFQRKMQALADKYDTEHQKTYQDLKSQIKTAVDTNNFQHTVALGKVKEAHQQMQTQQLTQIKELRSELQQTQNEIERTKQLNSDLQRDLREQQKHYERLANDSRNRDHEAVVRSEKLSVQIRELELKNLGLSKQTEFGMMEKQINKAIADLQKPQPLPSPIPEQPPNPSAPAYDPKEEETKQQFLQQQQLLEQQQQVIERLKNQIQNTQIKPKMNFQDRTAIRQSENMEEDENDALQKLRGVAKEQLEDMETDQNRSNQPTHLGTGMSHSESRTVRPTALPAPSAQMVDPMNASNAPPLMNPSGGMPMEESKGEEDDYSFIVDDGNGSRPQLYSNQGSIDATPGLSTQYRNAAHEQTSAMYTNSVRLGGTGASEGGPSVEHIRHSEFPEAIVDAPDPGSFGGKEEKKEDVLDIHTEDGRRDALNRTLRRMQDINAVSKMCTEARLAGNVVPHFNFFKPLQYSFLNDDTTSQRQTTLINSVGTALIYGLIKGKEELKECMRDPKLSTALTLLSHLPQMIMDGNIGKNEYDTLTETLKLLKSRTDVQSPELQQRLLAKIEQYVQTFGLYHDSIQRKQHLRVEMANDIFRVINTKEAKRYGEVYIPGLTDDRTIKFSQVIPHYCQTNFFENASTKDDLIGMIHQYSNAFTAINQALHESYAVNVPQEIRDAIGAATHELVFIISQDGSLENDIVNVSQIMGALRDSIMHRAAALAVEHRDAYLLRKQRYQIMNSVPQSQYVILQGNTPEIDRVHQTLSEQPIIQLPTIIDSLLRHVDLYEKKQVILDPEDSAAHVKQRIIDATIDAAYKTMPTSQTNLTSSKNLIMLLVADIEQVLDQSPLEDMIQYEKYLKNKETSHDEKSILQFQLDKQRHSQRVTRLQQMIGKRESLNLADFLLNKERDFFSPALPSNPIIQNLAMLIQHYVPVAEQTRSDNAKEQNLISQIQRNLQAITNRPDEVKLSDLKAMVQYFNGLVYMKDLPTSAQSLIQYLQTISSQDVSVNPSAMDVLQKSNKRLYAMSQQINRFLALSTSSVDYLTYGHSLAKTNFQQYHYRVNQTIEFVNNLPEYDAQMYLFSVCEPFMQHPFRLDQFTDKKLYLNSRLIFTQPYKLIQSGLDYLEKTSRNTLDLTAEDFHLQQLFKQFEAGLTNKGQFLGREQFPIVQEYFNSNYSMDDLYTALVSLSDSINQGITQTIKKILPNGVMSTTGDGNSINGGALDAQLLARTIQNYIYNPTLTHALFSYIQTAVNMSGIYAGTKACQLVAHTSNLYSYMATRYLAMVQEAGDVSDSRLYEATSYLYTKKSTLELKEEYRKLNTLGGEHYYALQRLLVNNLGKTIQGEDSYVSPHIKRQEYSLFDHDSEGIEIFREKQRPKINLVDQYLKGKGYIQSREPRTADEQFDFTAATDLLLQRFQEVNEYNRQKAAKAVRPKIDDQATFYNADFQELQMDQLDNMIRVGDTDITENFDKVVSGTKTSSNKRLIKKTKAAPIKVDTSQKTDERRGRKLKRDGEESDDNDDDKSRKNKHRVTSTKRSVSIGKFTKKFGKQK